MSRTASNIGAVVFVLLLGFLLSGPIRDPGPRGGRLPAAAEASPTPAPEGSPSPEPAATTTPPTATTAPPTTLAPAPAPTSTAGQGPGAGAPTFLSSYPAACLRSSGRPIPGLVAALADGTVRVAPPGGAETASFAAKGPIAWSPSGTFLGARGGRVFTASGEERGPLFPGRPRSWAWSPTSDCALAVSEGALLWGAPGGDPEALIGGDVRDFAFSPDGQKLALIAGEGDEAAPLSLWAADLRASKVRSLATFEASGSGTLFGWSGDGTQVYYGIGRARSVRVWRASVDGSGGAPEALPFKAPPRPRSFRLCGDRPLMVTGGPPSAGLRFVPGDGITASGSSDVAAACPPNGRFVAAVRAPSGAPPAERRVVLLSPKGSLLQNLSSAGHGDDYPLWGPVGTGVTFVRSSPGGGAPQVWYIPEGSGARFTGLTLSADAGSGGYFEWGGLLDWSADRPAGRPLVVSAPAP